MQQVSAKEARLNWSKLLDQIEEGEEFYIVRRNKTIAKMLAVDDNQASPQAPSLKEFRKSIQLKMKNKKISLSKEIISQRRLQRF